MKHLGTTITEEDLIRCYDTLNNLSAEHQSVYGVTINEIELLKHQKELYDKAVYLDMWKKVKREFPFINKM